MSAEKLTDSATETGVAILFPGDSHFEELYLEARRKEGRIYSDAEVTRLPFASAQNPHRREWKLRAKSFMRFKRYLAAKGERLRLLDLGCGNGWFTAQLARGRRHTFCCVDINLHELQQGARLFGGRAIQFILADIFQTRLPVAPFDFIVLNGSIQYFPDLGRLMRVLQDLLGKGGEIHFLDSPWYKTGELGAARQKSIQYYSALGVPEMSRWYHQHTLEELASWRYRLLADPNSWSNRMANLLRLSAPGFPWIVIQRE